MNRLFCIFLTAACLTGCSSPPEAKPPPAMSQTMASRFTKPDMTRRSIYEKSMQASMGEKKGIGSWFTGKKQAAKAFTGGKTFAGSRAFETKSFAPARNQSPMAREGFAQGDKTPAYGDRSFDAGTSRYQSQSADEGSKVFETGEFATQSNRDALRSQKKNVRPEFIELEEHKRDPAYSEEQVKRLLGRD